MKVILLGANYLSVSLALNLIEENNDVTLVDENFDQFRDIQNVFDLRTIVGCGSHPEILKQADAENADMLIALSARDEANIIACRIAHTIFNIPTKIAQVTTRGYLEEQARLFGKDAIPIDVLVSPELSVARNVSMLIKYPGALQIAEFADGRLLMVCVSARPNGKLTGSTVSAIKQIVPETPVDIAAIFRNEKIVYAEENTVITSGDEVFFVAPHESVEQIMTLFGCDTSRLKNITIAGGGLIGMHLAELIQNDYRVKLLEPNANRAVMLAEHFDEVVVLQSSATNESVLFEENVARSDMMCAVTSDEEDNIMSALLCKHLGTRQVLALINRPSYRDLVRLNHVNIDITLSPQQASFSELLCHVRKGDTVAVQALQHSDAEMIELVAHGDARSSRVIGRPLSRIRLPSGVIISMIVRGDQVLCADKDLMIESGDHVIVLVASKKHIPLVERLFSVSATYS